MALVHDGVEILSEDECRDLLASSVIRRVAITLGALPAVLPVNFAVVVGDIVFLTGEGSKLRAALEQAAVAFEVDDFDAARRTGWSVLAVGMATEITDDDELAGCASCRCGPSPAATAATTSASGPGSTPGAGSADRPPAAGDRARSCVSRPTSPSQLVPIRLPGASQTPSPG